ncbi:general stress protein [Gorillibacterium sp. CAU 1737]|uniref:general stress protein n=1 Tax=Gorillibacterium sp. CAU 1737 TaxID=3140362 RepID=UPI003261490F
MNKKLVGVFRTEEETVRVIEALKRQGYTENEISVVGRGSEDIEGVSHPAAETKLTEGLTTGAAAGGVLGGTAGLLAGIGALAIPGIGPILAAGPIVAALTGAAVGAGAGGLVGGLVGLGFSEEEAITYRDYVDDGFLLVLVDADPEKERAVYDSFRDHHSLNADSYASRYGSDIPPHKLV